MVTDVTTGRVAVGKFGWKSQVPNLLHFSAEAYLNEMGITTPLFRTRTARRVTVRCSPAIPCGRRRRPRRCPAFQKLHQLPRPPPRLRDPAVAFRARARSFAPSPRRWGSYAGYRRLFAEIGCASCHVRSLTTGASPVAALQFQTFQPYSDFLLHDMGSLGDGIEQGQATGREMRTAPLWGLRLFTTFLHDGRARTIEEAISLTTVRAGGTGSLRGASGRGEGDAGGVSRHL